MKIKFGAIVTGAIGKAGGQNIQRFRNAYILRNITQPTNSNNRFKNLQKNRLATLSRKWSLEPQNVKDNWTELGTRMTRVDPFAQVGFLTGREAFISINQFWERLNGTKIGALSVNLTIPTITITRIEIVTSAGLLGVVISTSSGASYLEIRAQRLTSSSSFSRYQDAKTFVLSINPTSPGTNYNSFINTFGDIQPDTPFAFYARPINATGYPGAWQKVIYTIV